MAPSPAAANNVALKVLESLEVPTEALGRAWGLITDAAKYARFLKEINGVQYVDLKNTSIPIAQIHKEDEIHAEEEFESEPPPLEPKVVSIAPPRGEQADHREKRVFVTHGKNRELLPQIKELLEFGQFQPDRISRARVCLKADSR